MNTSGLVRVTVAAPGRRLDLALPERSSIAEMLPGLLRRAGEHLADRGVAEGGWVLRRADGSPLTPTSTLTGHEVLDGEVLHLMPARTEWPELEYDDLVDAIATGSARASRSWGPSHTRRAGLAAGVVGLALAMVLVVRAGPPWPGPALFALGAAVLAIGTGVVLARALGDANSGAVLAIAGLPCAALGGELLLAGDGPAQGLGGLGAPQLLVAGAALLLAAVVGLLGVVARAAVFVASVVIGLLTMVGAGLSAAGLLAGYQSAAVVAGAGLAFSPQVVALSIRLARVPLPVLPQGTADLLRDEPQPPRLAVYARVVRADALLTGAIAGLAAVEVGCQAMLVNSGDMSALILLGVITVGFLLRARLHPVLAQRVSLLAAGIGGAAALALGPLASTGLLIAGPVVVVVGALGVVAGLKPGVGPRLGRYAELLEIVVVLAVVPVLCAVLGLYGYLRGLGG